MQLKYVRGKALDYVLNGSTIVAFNEGGDTGWVIEAGWEHEVMRLINRCHDLRYTLPLTKFSDALQRRLTEAGEWKGWDI